MFFYSSSHSFLSVLEPTFTPLLGIFQLHQKSVFFQETLIFGEGEIPNVGSCTEAFRIHLESSMFFCIKKTLTTNL